MRALFSATTVSVPVLGVGVWSERGVHGAYRGGALSDGRRHAFHRGQADVSGGEHGGHAGLKRQRCAPQR